ncbi:MAG: radical SAM protein [Myxococcota bacterium]|jgi:MoaA/NifB/PqqE/SkfB family radical SAM enzyme
MTDKACSRPVLENPAVLENFEISVVDGKFTAAKTGPMPDEAFGYIERQCDRFNRFKTIGWFEGSRSVSLYDPPLATPVGKRSLVYRLRRFYLHERIPAAATLACTYACQLDCVHCSALLHKNSERIFLRDDQIRKIIDETIDMGCVNIIFTGGEPLLMKNIFDLVAHVDKKRATAVMFTNGEYLSRENVARLKAAGVYGVFISMDNPWPEEHEALRRRPGLFAKIEEGIRNLKEQGIIVGFSSYMTHDLLAKGGLVKLMDLGRDLGIGEITLFDAVPTGALRKAYDILLTAEDKQQIISETMRYYKLAGYPSLTAQAFINSERSMGCFAAYNQYYMTAYGELCPCDFTPISFGNVADEGVKAVWDRMTSHPTYIKRHKSCRMQDPEFRARYIDRIPDDVKLPYPIEKF